MRRRHSTGALACFALFCALAGCATPPGGQGAATGDQVRTTVGPAPVPGAATTAKQRGRHLNRRQIILAVYYLRTVRGRRYLVPEWHPVPHTRAVANAAVGELLGGQPLFADSRRPFPAGTRQLGVGLAGGTATVELSGAALRGRAGAARRWPLQALVHTVTQFPTVKRVVVKVGGRPVGRPLTRDPGIRLAPIALAEPGPDAVVKGDRLVVRGEASVYEGTVSLRLRDDAGRLITQGYATSDTGAPGRGSFAGALSFTPPASPNRWTLEAFEVSPENGEVVYSVQLDVWVGR